MIKELLKRDFGFDLDIAGGEGQSREDPICVLSRSDVDASYTECLVLRGIGLGRSVLWRTIGVGYVPGTEVIQRKIETKEVLETEIVNQVENYYFQRKYLIPHEGNIESSPAIYYDKEIDIVYPYELSWLHYDGLTDYSEQGRADLGYSLAYNAPGIKATVYVYPKVVGDTDKDVLELEIDAAIEEIKIAHGADEIEHDWGVMLEPGCIYYYYMSKHSPEHTSLLLIMRRGDYFVKLRCTFIDEPFMREITNQFKDAFVLLMRK